MGWTCDHGIQLVVETRYFTHQRVDCTLRYSAFEHGRKKCAEQDTPTLLIPIHGFIDSTSILDRPIIAQLMWDIRDVG